MRLLKRFDGSLRVVDEGYTRVVVLMFKYAFKFPRPNGWRTFLRGLLANMQEVQMAKVELPEFCPVLFALPGGWLVVMPRCAPLETDIDYAAFCEREGYTVPAEYKRDSFGLYQGRVVAVDYGN